MRQISISGRAPGALALGASICTLTLAAMAATANAAVVHAVVPYSAPQTGLATGPSPTALFNTCYFQFGPETPPAEPAEDVIDCAFTNPSNPNVNPQWKSVALGNVVEMQGDMVLTEGVVVLNPGTNCLAGGVMDPLCSDVVRFVNVNEGVNGQAHIFVASDGAAPADIATIPNKPAFNANPPPPIAGPIPRDEDRPEVLPVGGVDPVGQVSTKRQVNVVGASPVHVLLRSDIPQNGFSDTILVWY